MNDPIASAGFAIVIGLGALALWLIVLFVVETWKNRR